MLTSLTQKFARDYSLSKMAVEFGVLAVGAVVVLLVLGTVLRFGFELPLSFVRIICVCLWVGFVAWLWVVFVIAARQLPQERVLTGELSAMQAIFTVGMGLRILFSEPHERPTLDAIGIVLESVIVGFHIIYFTLAWGIGARLPLRTYVMFALMLGMLWWRLS